MFHQNFASPLSNGLRLFDVFMIADFNAHAGHLVKIYARRVAGLRVPQAKSGSFRTVFFQLPPQNCILRFKSDLKILCVFHSQSDTSIISMTIQVLTQETIYHLFATYVSMPCSPRFLPWPKTRFVFDMTCFLSHFSRTIS